MISSTEHDLFSIIRFKKYVNTGPVVIFSMQFNGHKFELNRMVASIKSISGQGMNIREKWAETDRFILYEDIITVEAIPEGQRTTQAENCGSDKGDSKSFR